MLSLGTLMSRKFSKKNWSSFERSKMHFKISTFTIKGQKMKIMLEIQTKFLNLSKIIIRAMVKTPAHSDDRLKSYPVPSFL